MNPQRTLTPIATRVVDEMVVMLGEMELPDIGVGELARRTGVAIPTNYHNFRSLNDVVAESTLELLHRFLVHWTRVLGPAVFYHPALGALTAIDFSSGLGRLRYQTSPQEDTGR